jgi:hypothetical protein
MFVVGPFCMARSLSKNSLHELFSTASTTIEGWEVIAVHDLQRGVASPFGKGRPRLEFLLIEYLSPEEYSRLRGLIDLVVVAVAADNTR